MAVYQIDPLGDPRWADFLEEHPHACVFHTPNWLKTLSRTYGYEPFVVTTSPPRAKLSNGIVFCKLRSWLTGGRIVSLPFSDHCQPLSETRADFESLMSSVVTNLDLKGWKYIELRPARPLHADWASRSGIVRSESFHLHKLDLRPDVDTLFRNFHKSCVQRKIQRAQREELTYAEGRSKAILEKFYHLLLLTRRRHQLPPQPRAWFQNLIDCFGNSVKIRVTSKDGQPVASILTLSFRDTVVYKYGCSDARHHNVGGMPFLFWRAIQEAKQSGAREFDFGRTELENTGLATFKERWGAVRSEMCYYRYGVSSTVCAASGWTAALVRQTCAHVPDSLLARVSRLLYRHVG